jgi:2-haloacid dehalogenase
LDFLSIDFDSWQRMRGISFALRAGCAAAFVARPGKVLYPLGPKPDITGPDFRSVAKQIVAAESRQA